MGGLRRDQIRTVLEYDYRRFQYLWVQMISEHLSDCSKVFRGDLQAMLILAIIGQSAIFRLLERGGRDAMPVPVLENSSISATSLSEILGIPRETVRRKLEWLRQQGWIEKDDDASWRLVFADGEASARHDLLALDRRGMDRLASFVSRIVDLAHRSKDDVAGG